MQRHGFSRLYFAVMLAIVTAGAIVTYGIFVDYVEELDIETAQKDTDVYNDLKVREEILNAECATIARGVFTTEIIDNPEQLDCISHNRTVHFTFVDGESGSFAPRFTVSGDSVTTDDQGVDGAEGQEYPVLFWDPADGTYQKAGLMMRIPDGG